MTEEKETKNLQVDLPEDLHRALSILKLKSRARNWTDFFALIAKGYDEGKNEIKVKF
jgi:hypothetical protein